MTNEEMIVNLKQFMTATAKQETNETEERLSAKISNEIAGVERRLNGKIDDIEQRLTAKISEAQKDTGDTMDNYIAEADAHFDKRFDDHERRIVRLERHAA